MKEEKPSMHRGKIEVSIDWVGLVEVRELRWPEAIELYEKVGGAYSDLSAAIASGGQVEAVIALITRSAELCVWLVERCCGKDKDWIDQRSVSAVMDLATEAAVLNVQVIWDRAKNIERRLGPLLRPADASAGAGAPEGSASRSEPSMSGKSGSGP